MLKLSENLNVLGITMDIEVMEQLVKNEGKVKIEKSGNTGKFSAVAIINDEVHLAISGLKAFENDIYILKNSVKIDELGNLSVENCIPGSVILSDRDLFGEHITDKYYYTSNINEGKVRMFKIA